MKFIKLLTLFAALLMPLGLLAQTCGGSSPTWTCTSAQWASPTTVQNTINIANPGDTIVFQAGSNSWTSGVTDGKGVSFSGAGSGRIIAYSFSPSASTAIGTGSKSFQYVVGTKSTGTPPVLNTPAFTVGQTLTVSELGHRANFMTGTVVSFTPNTGSFVNGAGTTTTTVTGGTLVMNITSTGGSCGSDGLSTCQRWLFSTPPSTVIIANSPSTILFTITEHTTFHTYWSGIKIQQGSNGVPYFTIGSVAGGQSAVIHDCWMEQNEGATDQDISFNTDHGLIYNCSFDATPYSTAPEGISVKVANPVVGTPPANSWTTAANWGSLDTNEDTAVYVESSDFHGYQQNSMDADDTARVVWRYNFMNHAAFGTHGFDTSIYGIRYFEYYNNYGIFNWTGLCQTSTCSNTVTFSNGSALITGNNAFAAGDTVQLTTTGGLPSGFTTGQYYYVLSTNLTSTTFELSLSNGGAAIVAGSAGSGTQGYTNYCYSGVCPSIFNQNNWIFVRGGSFVVHDSVLPDLNGGFYNPQNITLTEEALKRAAANPIVACWGNNSTSGLYHPAPRQVGMGRQTGTGTVTSSSTNSSATYSNVSAITTYVGDSEPGYIWGNTSAPLDRVQAVDSDFSSSGGNCSPFDTSPNYIVSGRDYFNTATKPSTGWIASYSPAAYPHPLASALTPPTNLHVTPEVQAFLSWQF